MTMKRAIEKIEAEIPNTPDPDKFLKGVTSGMSRCLEIISEEAETSYDECGELIKKNQNNRRQNAEIILGDTRNWRFN